MIVNAQLFGVVNHAVCVFITLVGAYTFAQVCFPVWDSPFVMEEKLLRAFAALFRIAAGYVVPALRGTCATFGIAAAVTLAVLLATYAESRAETLGVPQAASAALNLYMSVWGIATSAYAAWIVGCQMWTGRVARRATAASVAPYAASSIVEGQHGRG